ncbi:MAG: hypothetical protein ACK5WY_06450 [Holosporaceae bacterium]|jgi:hypothetical protein
MAGQSILIIKIGMELLAIFEPLSNGLRRFVENFCERPKNGWVLPVHGRNHGGRKA